MKLQRSSFFLGGPPSSCSLVLPHASSFGWWRRHWISPLLILAVLQTFFRSTTSKDASAAPSFRPLSALVGGSDRRKARAASSSGSGGGKSQHGFMEDFSKHGQDWVSGICHSREKQSPINIDDKLKDPPMGVIEYDYKPMGGVNLTVEAVDGIIHFNLPHMFGGHNGGLKYDGEWYGLGRVDFHARAEHLIKGDRYPIEMQFVHSRPGNPVRYAIVAVLLNAAKAPENLPLKNAVSAPFAVPDSAEVDFNTMFQHFVAQEPPKVEGNSTLLTLTEADPMDFGAFVGDLTHGEGTFVEYAGSLTSPPCSETVTWFVRREVQMISVGQANAFLNAVMNMTLNSGNFRSPMPLNYRPLKVVKAVRTPGLDRAETVRPQLPLGPNPRTDDEFRTSGYVHKVAEGQHDAMDYLKDFYGRVRGAANAQVRTYRPLDE